MIGNAAHMPSSYGDRPECPLCAKSGHSPAAMLVLVDGNQLTLASSDFSNGVRLSCAALAPRQYPLLGGATIQV